MTDDALSDVSPQDGREVQAIYANHLTVDIDLAEVRLNFGQVFDAGQPPQIAFRLVTTPVHLNRFYRLIADGCERYSAEYCDGTKAILADGEES